MHRVHGNKLTFFSFRSFSWELICLPHIFKSFSPEDDFFSNILKLISHVTAFIEHKRGRERQQCVHLPFAILRASSARNNLIFWIPNVNNAFVLFFFQLKIRFRFCSNQLCCSIPLEWILSWMTWTFSMNVSIRLIKFENKSKKAQFEWMLIKKLRNISFSEHA